MFWLVFVPVALLALLALLFAALRKSGKQFSESPGERKDYSRPNAPKTIVSKEITAFSCTFPTYSMEKFHGREIPYSHCEFHLTRQEKHALYTGTGSRNTEKPFLLRMEMPVPFTALDTLQTIIEKHNLAALNGQHKETRGIPEGNASRLQVEYASGECIFAADNAGMIFPQNAALDLYAFFINMTEEEGGTAVNITVNP